MVCMYNASLNPFLSPMATDAEGGRERTVLGQVPVKAVPIPEQVWVQLIPYIHSEVPGRANTTNILPNPVRGDQGTAPRGCIPICLYMARETSYLGLQQAGTYIRLHFTLMYKNSTKAARNSRGVFGQTEQHQLSE